MRWLTPFLCFLVSGAGSLCAQARQGNFRVAVHVTESTAGLFESVIKRELRALGDVEIVTPEEQHDYKFSVVVLCRPDSSCSDVTSYVVSWVFEEPYTRKDLVATLQMALLAVDTTTVSAELLTWRAFLTGQTPSEAQAFLQDVSQLMNTMGEWGWETPAHIRGHWVSEWGRDRYRQSIADRVSEIDASCFEKGRLYDRLFSAGASKDSVAIYAIRDRILGDDADWWC